MKSHQWCQKFKLEKNLDGVLEYLENKMATCPFMTPEDHSLLAKNSRYWDWYTRDIENSEILDLLNTIEARHSLPINTEKTRIALCEYGKGDELPPHIDPNISLSSSIIISLIGRFETRLHDEMDNTKVLDKVIYGPGDYIILNNTICFHGGKPLDDYRLALVAFVDPSFDMSKFWR